MIPRDAAVEAAYQYIGEPYVFAGGDLQGPTSGGFSRAGFLRRVVYAAAGIDIGQTFADQLRHCTPRATGETAQAGDILFWKNPGSAMQPIRHAALYTGVMTVIGTDLRGLVDGAVFQDHPIDGELLVVRPDSDLIIATPPYGPEPAQFIDAELKADALVEQIFQEHQREVATRTWNYAQILDVFAAAAVHSDDHDARYAYLSGVFGVTEESLAQSITKVKARRERLDAQRRERRAGGKS
ncbi:NlpC/P60 family protein [Mycobacteroides abscessus]|uniref:NlpC/P60 family protein n=1 Tax=Mycobacteroides abscessus TaxID=36809 RepID=UPI0009A67B22|nr:NlpC/P60 family protein [Mycobacteroides abscessus]SKH88404.1 Uncharacterised protein [Mycobacteroides abscessus subsp. massiliense]SKH92253.1 Uncharacterised protein [Mycobacteroides abscessus subsp. massiliense]SKI12656.1 Uncharacterised protein [Mycobacteroides abscessus subsp. massiliense]SKK21225.1 Uncharacterised protein [Mycobacteroides abscessus subsp. massiliense]SKK31977.1 Uncharacterised protein [Mycobacteroides abscessus subsp. massiliense]